MPHADETTRKQYLHKYYAEHKAERLIYLRQWRENNKVRIKAHEKKTHVIAYRKAYRREQKNKNRHATNERARRTKNPSATRAIRQRHYMKHKDAIIADHSLKNPKYRNWYYIRSYGITLEDYNRLLEKQNGLCFGCHRQPTGRRLQVDHCHKSSEVRALLCGKCNKALGLLDDNAETLTRLRKLLLKDRNGGAV